MAEPPSAADSTRYRSGSEFVFTEAEVTVSREAWGRIREMSREIGKIIHDEAMPSATPGGIRVGATLALFEVVTHDTAPRP